MVTIFDVMRESMVVLDACKKEGASMTDEWMIKNMYKYTQGNRSDLDNVELERVHDLIIRTKIDVDSATRIEMVIRDLIGYDPVLSSLMAWLTRKSSHLSNTILLAASIELLCMHVNTRNLTSLHIAFAAGRGLIDVVSYLIDKKCPMDGNAVVAAAKGGYILCLTLLLIAKCPRDGWACVPAAINGHLDCLKLLNKLGCHNNLIKNRDALPDNIQKYLANNSHLDSFVSRDADESGLRIDFDTYA
jgi:hypothetical protein